MDEITQRIVTLQARLASVGVLDIKFTRDPRWNELTWEQRANAVCDALEAWIDGRCAPATMYDRPAQDGEG